MVREPLDVGGDVSSRTQDSDTEEREDGECQGGNGQCQEEIVVGGGLLAGG